MNGLYTPHMEMGSTSSSSSDSLNGLKFGRKIYFGDVGFVVPAISGGGSALSTAAGGGPPPPKKGRSVVQGGKPPMCVVEGCKVDLSDAKTYYSRHKVCGMHSKSPKVIVGGLEQRFCQQCSRFHQLPEFDQGKRSCRRRLAGHNERRRKPPPGSLFSSSCYGYQSSSIFATENNGRTGAFLVDFTAYPRRTGRDSWPTARESETGNFLSHPWQTNSENPSPDHFLQGSAGGTRYPGLGILSGECLTGVSSDSGCALSLLSNQPNGSRNRPPNIGVSSSLNAERASVNYQTAPPCAAFSHFSGSPWGFRVIEASDSSHEIGPDLGLSQISQSGNVQYSSEFEVSQQSGRKYLEFDHFRTCDSSTQFMNWSL